MIDALLLSLALAPAPVAPAPATVIPTASPLVVQDRGAEFEQKFEAAKDDVDALWDLHKWTEAYGLTRESKKVLRQIVKLDDDQARAHELLGHVKVDGRWFDSQKKADKYLEKKLEAEAKEKGWVKYDGRWVDPKHIPFLEQGLVQDEDGNWVDPVVLQRLEEGWVRQDLEWIAPDEQENIAKGLWKVGDEWLSLEDANKAHSELYQWWRIPGNRFTIWSTADREQADKVLREIDSTYRDLIKVFGREPARAPHVIMLRDIEQYSTFAGGSEKDQVPPADGIGSSAIHGAFLADTLYNAEGFYGTGAGYWDASTDEGNAFGRHFARHAAGLAYVEAIDPSPEFEEKVLKSSRTLERGLDKFYEEKRIPAYLRHGAAAYVDRFFTDRAVKRGGDAEWASKWAYTNIVRKGGLSPIDDIIDIELDARDENAVEQSVHLLMQTGLLVKFMVSRKNGAVTEAHEAWKQALITGEDYAKATKALTKVLRENESAFRSFAEQLEG